MGLPSGSSQVTSEVKAGPRVRTLAKGSNQSVIRARVGLLPLTRTTTYLGKAVLLA